MNSVISVNFVNGDVTFLVQIKTADQLISDKKRAHPRTINSKKMYYCLIEVFKSILNYAVDDTS